MENRVCKLIFVQIGSPASLDIHDIKAYLRDFLSDQRIVDINPIIWRPILEYFILGLRAKKLVKRYQSIWFDGEFALVKNTRELNEYIKKKLEAYNIECDYAFLFGKKTISELISEDKDIHTKKIIIMPLFPQYSLSTWGVVEDHILKAFSIFKRPPEIRYLKPFFAESFYIKNISQQIMFKISDVLSKHGKVDNILISFHGLPIKQITKKNDPYLEQCKRTFELIQAGLSNVIQQQQVIITFQSKFGFSKWLEPSTNNWLKENSKGKNILIISPSFISDSLETLVEINQELREKVEANGGNLFYINCLNSTNIWMNDFSQWLQSEVSNLF